MRVRLLGGFSLAWDETPLPPIAGRPARSLFAYLITHRDRAHTRDLLAGTFWPELPDAQARRRLSHALWQIGRMLGPLSAPAPYLLAGGETVRFNAAAPYWLDVEEFEALLDREDGRSADWARCQRAAVALYRGDFLAGFYDDWMVAERERLRELQLAALDRLLALSKRGGAYEEALGYAHRLVAEDPLDEERHREVMRLCHVLGRRHEAQQQFERCAAILAAELGAEPSAATAALWREIAAQGGPTQAPYLPPLSGARPAPLLEGAGQAPLVGRAAERTALIGWLEQAGSGCGGLVLIEGEAGIGKTRLLQEVARDAGWRGLPVLWGHGAERGDALPYGPLQEALRAGLSPLRAGQLAQLVDEAWLREASLLLPELAGDRVQPAATLHPDRGAAALEEQRARLLEALSRVVLALGELTPCLFILEDLHWAGEDTFRALSHLAPLLPAGRAVVMASFRSGEARARPAVWAALQALDRGGCRRLELAPLSAEETGDLVRLGLGLAAPAPYFAARLHRETRGNPLFLSETLRALRDEGVLYRDAAGAWSTPWDETTADYAELPLPDGVRRVIERRLARLGPDERTALAAAAVLGPEFDLALLLHTSGQQRQVCLAACGQLVRRRLLDEGPAAYRFGHERVAEVVYASLPDAARRCLHGRAGEMLEGREPQPVEDLAYHFAQGGLKDKAVAYGLRAGDRAWSLCAAAEALTRYDRCLALSGEDDPAARWEIQQRREEVLHLLGRRAEQAAGLAELQRLAAALGDERRRSVALCRQGRYDASAGAPRQALARLQEAAGLALSAGDLSLAGECQVMIGRAHWLLGDAPRCLAAAEAAGALFRQAGDRAGEVHALNLMGNLYLGILGHHERALRCFERVLAIAEELRDDAWGNAARTNIGVALMSLGRYGQSEMHLARAGAFFARTGNKPTLTIIAFARGHNALGLGDCEAAQRFAAQGLALCRETDNPNFALENLAVLGQAALHLGQYRRAADCFAEAAATARAGEQMADLGWLQSYLALAHLRLGETGQALALSAASCAMLESPNADVIFSELICFHHSQVLAETEGRAAARPYLERAHQFLLDKADAIEDPELRCSFLEDVHENRAIVAAYRAAQAGEQPIRVRLPRAGAPTGRPLRQDERVEVAWTVAATGDAAVAGKTGRRRHRLLRLLREAAAQGAAPTVDDLAAALGASRATIKRDLAALRGAGQKTRTRGSRQP